MTTMTAAPPVIRAIAPPAGVTPDDLLGMEEDGLFELVNGRLVEKRMAMESNWIGGEVAFHLKLHLRQTRSGDVFPEQTFQCFPNDPDQTRRPDVAYIAAGRVPTPWPAGHVRVTPDLAVEVVSPNDNAEELELKLADYRAAKIPLVWVVWPAVRMVRVHPLGGPIVELFDGDTLGGDPVLPGFVVAVTDLFPPRPNPNAPAADADVR